MIEPMSEIELRRTLEFLTSHGTLDELKRSLEGSIAFYTANAQQLNGCQQKFLRSQERLLKAINEMPYHV